MPHQRGTVRFFGTYIAGRFRNEITIQFQHRKFRCIEYLVAEFSIAFYAKNFKVDIATCMIIVVNSG